MEYIYNENNDAKFKFRHKLKFLGKASYLFGCAIFPNILITSLLKRKHKKLERAYTCHQKTLGKSLKLTEPRCTPHLPNEDNIIAN